MILLLLILFKFILLSFFLLFFISFISSNNIGIILFFWEIELFIFSFILNMFSFSKIKLSIEKLPYILLYLAKLLLSLLIYVWISLNFLWHFLIVISFFFENPIYSSSDSLQKSNFSSFLLFASWKNWVVTNFFPYQFSFSFFDDERSFINLDINSTLVWSFFICWLFNLGNFPVFIKSCIIFKFNFKVQSKSYILFSAVFLSFCFGFSLCINLGLLFFSVCKYLVSPVVAWIESWLLCLE